MRIALKWTCRLEIGMRNLTNVDKSTKKSQDFHFNALFLRKVYVTTLKRDTKFGEEPNCRFKIDVKNLTNLELNEHSKVSKVFILMGSFWVKHILFEVKKQKRCQSWHWRVMLILKKNRLVVWKMTWGIWKIFTRAFDSVKIETLMGYFCLK